MEEDRAKAEAEYSVAFRVLIQAQDSLTAALQKLHKFGISPSPPPHRHPMRYRMPDERLGMTHKFEIGLGDSGFEGYLTTGAYPDGKLGEIFITASKKGTFISGLLDAFSVLFSMALQSGIPLETLTTKFKFTKFEPAGMTQNPQIGVAHSVLDYAMKWLEINYGLKEVADAGKSDGPNG